MLQKRLSRAKKVPKTKPTRPQHANSHTRPFATKRSPPRSTAAQSAPTQTLANNNNTNVNSPSSPQAYFQRFQQIDFSATQIDVKDSLQSSLSFESQQTPLGGKDLMAQQTKSIKLGKHKTKQRVDNTQHISKSLSLAMKTGRLPSLIQHVESPLDLTPNYFNEHDEIPFTPGQQRNRGGNELLFLPSQSLLNKNNNNFYANNHNQAQHNSEIEEDVNKEIVFDDDWTAAYNTLVSTGLEDLSIKATSAVIRNGDYSTHPSDFLSASATIPTSQSLLDGTSKSERVSGFSQGSIYSTAPAKFLPKDTDIAAAATAANWFPGHMKKALEDMADKIRHVPLSIEVRDARLPLSSANPLLDSLTSHKTKIIVLNKTDLVKDPEHSLKLLADVHGLNYRNMLLDRTVHSMVMQTKPKTTQSAFDKMVNSHNPNEKSPVDAWINSILRTHTDLTSLPRALIEVPHIISPDRRLAIILTNNSNLDTTKSLLTLIKALAPRRKFESIPTSAIICGYPNVGKSTIINNLKISARMTLGRDGLEQGKWSLGTVTNTVSKARAKIGPLPGVTRQVQGFKVANNPPVVILDSPGIMVPRFDRSPSGINTSYKLALIQCISDVIAEPKVQCDHLLRILNSVPPQDRAYPRYYETPLFAPIVNLQVLAHFICKKEEIETQSVQNWRESCMKTQFGKVLSTRDYHLLIHRARVREREMDVGMGAVLNRYESVKKIEVDMRDFSPSYQFPSVDELQFEMPPDLEDVALRSLLRSFRTELADIGPLGFVPESSPLVSLTRDEVASTWTTLTTLTECLKLHFPHHCIILLV